MERVENDSKPSAVTAAKEEGPLKEPVRVGLGDRSKRDEWSEGAVVCLLDAYESKWVLRNRAKLKGHDWEDVARLVSSRANSSKSAKTPTQCKNKVESMKKRYRSESASGGGSRWTLFPRLDGLVRWRAPATPPPPPILPQTLIHQPPPFPPPPPPPPPGGTRSQHSLELNGVTAAAQGVRSEAGQPDGARQEPESSTPSYVSYKEKQKMKQKKRKRRRDVREEEESWEVMESMQWLADVVLRVAQSRLDTMIEVQRMRAKAETRKGEMDLKRTEIIANTQLQIAKLVAAGSDDRVDPSLRIGRG